MKFHWHASVDNIILYGVSAIIVINLVCIASAQLVQHDATEPIGKALGSLV